MRFFFTLAKIRNVNIPYWMGSCPISLDIGRVCAVFGRVRRTSQIQARRVQCPVILDSYPSNEMFIVHHHGGACSFTSTIILYYIHNNIILHTFLQAEYDCSLTLIRIRFNAFSSNSLKRRWLVEIHVHSPIKCSSSKNASIGSC